MDNSDVKEDVSVSEAPVAEGEQETPGAGSQPVEQTTVTGGEEDPGKPVEKMIPYQRFAEVNRKLRALQRERAEEESRRQYEGSGLDDDALLNHPFVQGLLIKDAKRELADYAREVIDRDYPNLHPQLKKAILANARGFINEETTDVETAKIDLLDYIERVNEEEAQAQAQQNPNTPSFQVAQTNQPTTHSPGIRPAEIQAILDKPVDEWTEEDVTKMAEYQKAAPKK